MADMDFKKRMDQRKQEILKSTILQVMKIKKSGVKQKVILGHFIFLLFACLSLDVLVFYFYREGNF